MRLCTCLAVLAVLFLPVTAAASTPQISYGEGSNEPIPVLGGTTCQHGFEDEQIGSGWTLSTSQQLGIVCEAPGAITGVGFYCEFTFPDGYVDIVISDNTGEVSRTNVYATAGTNNFDIDDVTIDGDACIMLCPTTLGAVTGEDYTSPPYGLSFWSNACGCDNAFTDNNLTIWADTGTPTATEPASWGMVRSFFR